MRHWLDWELDFIERARGKMTLPDIASTLDRTVNSIRGAIWRLDRLECFKKRRARLKCLQPSK